MPKYQPVGAEDTACALEVAENARTALGGAAAVERADYLYKIASGLTREKDHFARLLVMEQGKTLADVDDAIRYLTYAA